MAIDSRFTYARSVCRDVATTIGSVRHLVPADHLSSLDLLTRELADTFAEHEAHFDVDDFMSRASYRRDTPNKGEYEDE